MLPVTGSVHYAAADPCAISLPSAVDNGFLMHNSMFVKYGFLVHKFLTFRDVDIGDLEFCIVNPKPMVGVLYPIFEIS